MSYNQYDSTITIDDQMSAATYFAPPERLNAEEIAVQVEKLMRNEMLVTAFDAVPITLVILNEQRQIIGANSSTKEQFGDSALTVLGKRPGEAFNCKYAPMGPGGCGTGKACATCGAVRTILETIDTGQKSTGECCLESVGSDGNVQCLELKVTVSPFRVENNNEKYYSLILEDNSQTKRLEVFQRLFFHDVLNTIGCIKGYVDILRDGDFGETSNVQEDCEPSLVPFLVGLCDQLHDEVNAHRQLISAENGELVVKHDVIRPQDIIDAIACNYQKHEIGEGHFITTLPSQCGEGETDHLLLMRILGNMTKNAIEASQAGSTITLSCTEDDGQITFYVNNPGVIPDEVRYQIFKRSFSTKQKVGRGIGTYSMRLLGEKYLGGEVGFDSDEQFGTTFWVRIPVKPMS